MRNITPPSRNAGQPGARLDLPTQMMTRRSRSCSSQAIQPPGGILAEEDVIEGTVPALAGAGSCVGPIEPTQDLDLDPEPQGGTHRGGGWGWLPNPAGGHALDAGGHALQCLEGGLLSR